MSPDHLHGVEASEQDSEGQDKYHARFAEDESSPTEQLDTNNEAGTEEVTADSAAHQPTSRLDDAISLDSSRAQVAQHASD